MLSRRSFLVGGLALSAQAASWYPVWAKHKPVAADKPGPHLLTRQDWPPAIAPAQIGITDHGICCFTDEYGRLALVDFRKAAAGKPATVLGELHGFAKKVIAFRVTNSRAYAIVTAEVTPASEPQLALVTLNLANVSRPHVSSQIALDKFADASTLTVDGGIICVGGTSNSGEQMVIIYMESKGGHGGDPISAAAFSASLPVRQLILQDRKLLILESGQDSQLQYVFLREPASPELRKTLPLDGDFTAMARMGDIAVVAGSFEIANQPESQSTNIGLKSIALSPIPHVVSQIPLNPLTAICDVTATKNQFLVLGDADQDTSLVAMTCDKLGVLKRLGNDELTKLKPRMGQSCRIAAKERTAYIATGWAGVQMLTFESGNWNAAYQYTIPRYAASSIAAWRNLVVLAGSDMKLYDISQPDKPALISTTEGVGNTKNIVGAGSFVLCLYKDSLTLRKMQKLDEVVATLKITGTEVCFDPVKQKAYVLQSNNKSSSVAQIQAYSNSLVAENNFELPNAYSHIVANEDYFVVCSLNELALYKNGATVNLIGTRSFDNLAIRDLALTRDYILLTAVDPHSKGSFIILSKSQKDLTLLGSTDLPNDGRALAVSKGMAVVIGQADGRDAAAVVDFTVASAPKAVASLNVVEDASAVTIKDETAIVGGRGLEIFSLT